MNMYLRVKKFREAKPYSLTFARDPNKFGDSIKKETHNKLGKVVE